MAKTSVHPIYGQLIEEAAAACRRHYGARLVSVAVFGSVARGTPSADSDIDLLIVADPLPTGRVARSAEFAAVEQSLAEPLLRAERIGLHPTFSAVFKTRSEVAAGSPLFLDMLDDARIVVDRGGFLRGAFAAFAARLARLGSRRVWRGDHWFWDLKPDYKPGEVFEL
ncbi:MAG: nucleotidyltransferase domain-containing protein [Cyanobacteria bacterium]|nr:nucleotidyltransferase domain-containing protein [Cyanobacteriota bacterium]